MEGGRYSVEVNSMDDILHFLRTTLGNLIPTFCIKIVKDCPLYEEK